jgi:hypothetical protein
LNIFRSFTQKVTQLQRRLLKEYKKVQEDKNKAFTATIDPENITKWNAAVFGPDRTEWEDGVFRLTVVFQFMHLMFGLFRLSRSIQTEKSVSPSFSIIGQLFMNWHQC